MVIDNWRKIDILENACCRSASSVLLLMNHFLWILYSRQQIFPSRHLFEIRINKIVQEWVHYWKKCQINHKIAVRPIQGYMRGYKKIKRKKQGGLLIIGLRNLHFCAFWIVDKMVNTNAIRANDNEKRYELPERRFISSREVPTPISDTQRPKNKCRG